MGVFALGNIGSMDRSVFFYEDRFARCEEQKKKKA